MEDHLLKPIIPFIRIGHMPRGRYLKLMGDLIMVTSNVKATLQSILPVPQNLIPITLKRKMEYKGHYMQEFIDKKKVVHYFSWFQSHNHIFKDLKLDENLIKDFEKYTQEVISKADEENDDLLVNHY